MVTNKVSNTERVLLWMVVEIVSKSIAFSNENKLVGGLRLQAIWQEGNHDLLV